MKKNLKRVIIFIAASVIGVSPAAGSAGSPFVITAEAHSGRTDSSGGHHDYKNKSGLGSYHYHCGGYPAHLHTNGVCPYKSGGTAGSNQGSTASSGSGAVNNTAPVLPEPTAAAEPTDTLGWKLDAAGWWYKDSETTYKKDGIYYIDGYYYRFNSEGYMLTGWQEIDDDWYYFDGSGHMLIDLCVLIDDSYCYFDKNGKWDEEYYDSYAEYEEMYDDSWDY